MGFDLIDGELQIDDDGEEVLEKFLHISPKAYEESKIYFRNNCETMAQYLEYYNMLDVELLMKSIDMYSEGFYTQWGINIHQFLSLPGIAESLAYKNYPKTCAPIYSFGDKFKKYSNEIRR